MRTKSATNGGEDDCGSVRDLRGAVLKHPALKHATEELASVRDDGLVCTYRFVVHHESDVLCCVCAASAMRACASITSRRRRQENKEVAKKRAGGEEEEEEEGEITYQQRSLIEASGRDRC